MKTLTLIASTGITLVLLAACGGGGGADFDPVPTPVPAPTPTPAPAPTPVAGFPKDYQLPYLSPTQGIYTVSANALGSSTLRSPAKPLLSLQVYDGEWTNGVVLNSRPYGLVFLDGNRWKALLLRTGSTQSVIDTGITETRTVCTDFFPLVAPDYATPGKPLISYAVADASGSCNPGDAIYTAFRIGSTGLTDLGINSSPRQFRDSNGGLTGYLAQVGAELRLYKPGASTFMVVASGITDSAFSAASFARTASSVWLRWNNGTQKAIYRVDANGTVSAPLYSVPSADSLFGGSADGNALFVRHITRGSGTTEIVRVPYSGNASVIASLTDSPIIVAATDSTLFLSSTGSGSTSVFSILPKAGGTPVQVATTENGRDDFTPVVNPTSTGQYSFNVYSGTDATYTSTAMLVSAQGQVLESLNNSEWIGSVAGDADFSKPAVTTVRAAERIESYAGPLRSTGHRGGTLAVRDFSNNNRRLVTQFSASGILQGSDFGLSADLATFTPVDNSDTDIFSVDLDNPALNRITSTAAERETIP